MTRNKNWFWAGAESFKRLSLTEAAEGETPQFWNESPRQLPISYRRGHLNINRGRMTIRPLFIMTINEQIRAPIVLGVLSQAQMAERVWRHLWNRRFGARLFGECVYRRRSESRLIFIGIRGSRREDAGSEDSRFSWFSSEGDRMETSNKSKKA